MTTSTMRPSPIPVPDFDCGCPGGDRGRHKTTCEPAQAYESTPLRDRPGYAEGQSFRCVSWDYPLRLSVSVTYDIELDPAAFIAKHRAAYDAFTLDRGYEPWEKPIQFLSSLIEDDDPDSVFGGWRGVSSCRAWADDWRESPQWTEADTDALHRTLGVQA